MPSLSVLILTKNSSNDIARALASVNGLADEIVVVDDLSTDETESIVSSYPQALFFSHKMVNFSSQRNFGLSHCTSDYVLVLDSDECLSPELVQRISTLKMSMSGNEMFIIPRKNFLWRSWRKYSSGWPDYQTRLFPTGAHYVGDVHEKVEFSDGVISTTLDEPILHFSTQSLGVWFKKVLKYAPLEAQQRVGTLRGGIISSICVRPFSKFIYLYLVKRCILDGIFGFLWALLGALYEFCVGLYLLELKISR